MVFLPSVFAHAFGQNYSLPLPLWLFLFAAGAVVLLSFVIFGLLLDEPAEAKAGVKPRWRSLGIIVPIGKILGATLLLVSIAADFNNINDTGISLTFFWILLLLGFTYLTALAGNLWDFVNPFKTLFEAVEALVGRPLKPLVAYPKKWAYWPALFTYYSIIWLELASYGFGVHPDNLSRLLLTYTLLTLLSAYFFGKKVWFKQGEFFSVFFNLVAKVSPIEIQDGKFLLRKPFSGLLKEDTKDFSLIVFVLFMLASTGFDGFKETSAFSQLTDRLPDFIISNYQLYQSIFLLISPFLLLGVYFLAIWGIKHLVTTKLSTLDLAKKFAFSLIPIAIAYNAAHYFSLFWLDAPSLIGYLLDPFDLGWSSFQVYGNPINASTIWYSQITLIIAGHVAAVYTAHKAALLIFNGRKAALKSQYLMILLMIFYTMGSLWIIGQPLDVNS
jgi:hypothetical protein